MRKEFWKSLVMVASIIHLSVPAAAQLIRHSYHFYNNFSASAPDCGPDLTQSQAGGNCNPAVQPGSFISDTFPGCGLTRTVYHNNIHWGLGYPNTAGTITSTYTIHVYVKTTNWGTLPWVRIIDFTNGLSDNGIYYKQETASPDRCIDFWPNGIVGPCPYFNSSTYYLLTFTRNGATGMLNVYVNNTLFSSYNDAAGIYTGTAGTPVYIYRDDQPVPCESGEANFGYLAFTNQFSSQTMVDSVYNLICSIANPGGTSTFSVTPNPVCTPNNITVTYTGNIASPGTGYSFNWNWDGGTVVSGSAMGPYVINWSTPGIKNVTLTITNNSCGNQNSNTQQILIGSKSASTVNQTICEGQSFLGYTTSGNYIDTLRDAAGCDSVRTLNLTVKTGSFSTISQSICEGQSLLGYTVTGVYKDTFVIANGCDSIRTLNLTVTPVSYYTFAQSICEGQSFLGYTATGIYKDTFITANGCDSIRTLNLTVLSKPAPDLGPDKELCRDDSLILNPGPFTSYLWQDGSTREYFEVKQPGIYSVAVTNNCGTATDAITITERVCIIYFPSAFTPDGNGRNDLFKILNAFNLQEYDLSVYNRWGQKLFHTKNVANGWDGTFNGQLQNTGVFIWICRFKKNNIENKMKGTVVLIR